MLNLFDKNISLFYYVEEFMPEGKIRTHFFPMFHHCSLFKNVLIERVNYSEPSLCLDLYYFVDPVFYMYE